MKCALEIFWVYILGFSTSFWNTRFLKVTNNEKWSIRSSPIYLVIQFRNAHFPKLTIIEVPIIRTDSFLKSCIFELIDVAHFKWANVIFQFTHFGSASFRSEVFFEVNISKSTIF